MVEVRCPRFRRSYLRGLWPLGDQLYKAKDNLCLPHCVISWVVSKADASLGSFRGNWSGRLSALNNLRWHWNKWVGKELLGWVEDHPQVSWMLSGVRLLSHDLWSPDMQQWCLFIYQKIRVSDVVMCLSLCDGWRKQWSSDCQELRGISGMCQLARESD